MKTRDQVLTEIKTELEKGKTLLTSGEFSLLLKQLEEYINEEKKYL